MKVGNVAHAIGLSVIGVGAIAALFLQLRGRMAGSPQAAKRAPLASAQQPASAETDVLPKVVYGDPFTHPKLVRLNSEAKLPPPEASTEPPKGPEKKMPEKLSGSLGFSPLLPNTAAIVADPEKSPTPPEVKGPSVSLQAVVTATSPVAFLSIDGKEPQQFGVGDSISDGVVIGRIRDGEITLKIKNGEKVLRVGEKLQL